VIRIPGARLFLPTLLSGCAGGADGSDTATFTTPLQGLAVGLRAPDGSPETDVTAYLAGAFPALPDAAGFVYYLDVTPGRAPLFVRKDGYALAYSAPTVSLGGLAGSSLELIPLDPRVVGDPGQESVVDAGAVTMTIPPDAVQVGGAPVVGPWTVGAHVISASERWAIPGDLQAVTDDVVVAPIVLQHVTAARGWQGDQDVSPLDETLEVTVSLPEGDPLLAPSVQPMVYQYSNAQTYWLQATPADIDPVERTATFQVSNLGWWGLGRSAFGQGCVRGRVVDAAGDDLIGAQVGLALDGTLGVDRRTADENGFCMPIDPGVRGDLRVIGFAGDRSALYTWSGEVTGGPEAGTCDEPTLCLDLGTLSPDAWPDADGDLHFAGPGGDCDDEEPTVNPSFANGDGTYCGGPLW
jgi:hypothetical protein